MKKMNRKKWSWGITK